MSSMKLALILGLGTVQAINMLLPFTNFYHFKPFSSLTKLETCAGSIIREFTCASLQEEMYELLKIFETN